MWNDPGGNGAESGGNGGGGLVLAVPRLQEQNGKHTGYTVGLNNPRGRLLQLRPQKRQNW